MWSAPCSGSTSRLLWSSASQKEILRQITSCSREHGEQQCLRQYRVLSSLDLLTLQEHPVWGQSSLISQEHFFLLCSVSTGTQSLAWMILLQVGLTLYQETAWFKMPYFFVPVAFSSTLVPSYEFFGQVVFVLVVIPHRTRILNRKQIYLWWDMIHMCVCYKRDTQSCSFCVDLVPSPFWRVVQNKEWKGWGLPSIWSLQTDSGCTDSLYVVQWFPGHNQFLLVFWVLIM